MHLQHHSLLPPYPTQYPTRFPTPHLSAALPHTICHAPLCAPTQLCLHNSNTAPLCRPAHPPVHSHLPSPQRQGSVQPDRHRVVVSTDGLMPSTSASYADEEDYKYARRAHPLKRTLQRLFPDMFAPGLPVTSRWVFGVWVSGCVSQPSQTGLWCMVP